MWQYQERTKFALKGRLPYMYQKCDGKSSYFYDQLSCKIGSSILLFSIDGMSYFGRLVGITENLTAVLTPSPLSDSGLVEILNPAEIAAGENRSIVEAESIVAFAFDITADPFVMPDDNAEDVGEEPASPTAASPMQNAPSKSAHDDAGYDLKGSLEDMIGRYAEQYEPVTLASLGGFLFAGTIRRLCYHTALLDVEYIFAPGGDGSTLFSVGEVLVNLPAVTSVSS
jgi:hypothetical protein